LPLFGFDLDTTAARIQNSSNRRQPDSTPSTAARFDAVEGLENPVQLILRDARPGIGYVEAACIVFSIDPDLHAPHRPACKIFDGVSDDICQDDMEQAGLAAHNQIWDGANLDGGAKVRRELSRLVQDALDSGAHGRRRVRIDGVRGPREREQRINDL